MQSARSPSNNAPRPPARLHRATGARTARKSPVRETSRIHENATGHVTTRSEPEDLWQQPEAHRGETRPASSRIRDSTPPAAPSTDARARASPIQRRRATAPARVLVPRFPQGVAQERAVAPLHRPATAARNV